MKLAAMVCSACSATLDTDDRSWVPLVDGDYGHMCGWPAVTDEGGRAVLRRRGERDAAIADANQVLGEQGRVVERQLNAERRERRQRELGLVR